MSPPHPYTIVITAQIESRFVIEDNPVPFRCRLILSFATLLQMEASEGDVIDSTRNGHRDTRCSSARHLAMVREDIGVRSVGCTGVWTAVNEAVALRGSVYVTVFWTTAKAPSIKGLSDVKADLHSKLKLKCRISGNPPPKVVWFKNGLKLKADGRIKLRSKRRYSHLIINRVSLEDEGHYKCIAKNVLGNATAFANVIADNATTTTESPFWQLRKDPCPRRNFCLNGGICIYFAIVKEYACECADGYGGQRCETKVISTLSIVSYRVLKVEVNKEKIQFLFDKSENASQVAEIANGVYGADIVTANYVQFWSRRFRSGILNVKDAPRTGRPVVENVDKITEVIEVDRHVPHQLTPKNMMNRISICEAFAKRNKIDPFLKRRVTGDEKCIPYDNIVRKRSWSKRGEAAQTMVKQGLTARKDSTVYFVGVERKHLL
ncbi:pro-neuregulin-2, membrane-bound isoform [Trichonephila clavipes]|nr:pro-neuregulin-2, membrane-bound isoform [Trichonephila clavipes]